MEFFIFFLEVFMFIVYLGIILSSVFMIYCLFSSHFYARPPTIPSSGVALKTLLSKLEKQIKECEEHKDKQPFNIVDAGCGIGTAIIPLAKLFPEHNFVGIEINWLPYKIAKFRAKKIRNLNIIHQDLFSYNFNEFNFIICFLINHMMESFTDKITNEIQKKTYVFANRFKLKNIEPTESIDFGDNFSSLHLYTILPKNTNNLS